MYWNRRVAQITLMHHEEQFHRRIPDRSLLTEGKKAAAADGLASSMWAQKQKRRRSRKASGVKFVRVKVDTSDLFSCRKKNKQQKKKSTEDGRVKTSCSETSDWKMLLMPRQKCCFWTVLNASAFIGAASTLRPCAALPAWHHNVTQPWPQEHLQWKHWEHKVF